MTLGDLIQLVRLSYRAPRAGARALIDMNLPHSVVWQALVLMAIVLTLLGSFGTQISGSPTGEAAPDANLFGMAVVHLVLLVTPAALVHVIGERTGGKARFADAMLLLLWLQFLILPIQIAATIMQAQGSGLTGGILLVYVVVTFWLMTNFVTELHGYRSRLHVFLGILAVSVVLGLLLLPFLDPAFAGASENV
jgi:hypothetical protein